MATKQDEHDPVTAMRASIDQLKGQADKMGVAQWRALRQARRDLGALIKVIEGTTAKK
jgi:hypothetical protein